MLRQPGEQRRPVRGDRQLAPLLRHVLARPRPGRHLGHPAPQAAHGAPPALGRPRPQPALPLGRREERGALLGRDGAPGGQLGAQPQGAIGQRQVRVPGRFVSFWSSFNEPRPPPSPGHQGAPLLLEYGQVPSQGGDGVDGGVGDDEGGAGHLVCPLPLDLEARPSSVAILCTYALGWREA